MDSNKKNKQVNVPQGRVLLWGIIGIILGSMPTFLLLPEKPIMASPWSFIVPLFWACLMGWPITYCWSASLHKSIADLKEKEQDPFRVPWMPIWIGLFERAFYCIIIGLSVKGGAAFISVWVGIKLAGGWQLWSKGTTYGRAIFFSGLLGNAMSILFGLVAGIVIRVSIQSCTH